MSMDRRHNLIRVPGLLLLGIAIVALIAVACGSDEPDAAASPQQPQASAPAQAPVPASAAAQPLPAVTGVQSNITMEEKRRERAGLSGTIEIDGSSTIAPITEAVAEEFRKVAPGVQVNVGISGSGGGFKRFIVGDTDISDASRAIKDSEAATAADNGLDFYEFLVGVDGLSVMVSPNNDFVDCMTTSQLNELWKPESTVDSWSDLDSSWPDRRINLYGPGTDSGTFDYFTEEINGESKLSRADYVASEDDNVLVQGISGDRNALGYFGYAYYAANRDKLKLIAVDSGSGCVVPSIETIASGQYAPLSRPLFIYVNKERIQQRADLRSFVEFYMENAAELTAEVGYVPLSEQDYQANLAVIS